MTMKLGFSAARAAGAVETASRVIAGIRAARKVLVADNVFIGILAVAVGVGSVFKYELIQVVRARVCL